MRRLRLAGASRVVTGRSFSVGVSMLDQTQTELQHRQQALVRELQEDGARRESCLADHKTQDKTYWDTSCENSVHPRILTDNIASEEDCEVIVAATRAALSSGITQTYEIESRTTTTRMLPCVGSYSEDLLGMLAYAKVQMLVGRIQNEVESDYGVSVCEAGSLLQWRSSSQDETDKYSTSHIDKANRMAYDFSAVLYLTTAGVDFTGGSFAFNDRRCDNVVTPVAGRLVTFTSGPENVHQAQHVLTGNRLSLAAWFSIIDT